MNTILQESNPKGIPEGWRRVDEAEFAKVINSGNYTYESFAGGRGYRRIVPIYHRQPLIGVQTSDGGYWLPPVGQVGEREEFDKLGEEIKLDIEAYPEAFRDILNKLNERITLLGKSV